MITQASVVAALGIGAAWAVRGRSSAVFGPSGWRGGAGRNALALTFDDGPSLSTPLFLDILAEHRARATFFQVGANVERNPEIARAVVAAGHEVGNHSYSHTNFALKSSSLIEGDFARAQTAISEASGVAPTLARAPFGVRWFGFREMQARLGLTGVMWTVIGLDWKLPASAIANRVLRNASDGGIICLHDGRGTEQNPDVSPAVEAVRRVVPALMATGYHFVTVSELLWPTK